MQEQQQQQQQWQEQQDVSPLSRQGRGGRKGAAGLPTSPIINLSSQLEKEILDTMLDREEEQDDDDNTANAIGRVLLLLAPTADDVCGGVGSGSLATRIITTMNHPAAAQKDETKVTSASANANANATSAGTTNSAIGGMEEQQHLFLSRSPVTVTSNTFSYHQYPNKEEQQGSHSFVFLDSVMDNLERFEICKWYYTVVDYYGFDRMTVTIAMSYTDRVLWRKVSQLQGGTTGKDSIDSSRGSSYEDHTSFLQLLAVASLYLAIKLFEKHRQIHEMLFDFVLMSKGKFSADEITRMESRILTDLEWNVVQMPIPQQFMYHFMKFTCLSFPSMSKTSARKIMNHANYFMEVIAFDNAFAHVNASVIASAALMISIELINDTFAADAIRSMLEHTMMARKPFTSSCTTCCCGGVGGTMMVSRMDIILHVMTRMDAYIKKHGTHHDVV